MRSEAVSSDTNCHCECNEAISPIMAGDCFGKERLPMTAPHFVMLEASFIALPPRYY